MSAPVDEVCQSETPTLANHRHETDFSSKHAEKLSQNEFVSIVDLVSTSPQSLIINDGGDPASDVFKVESTTGDTYILGDIAAGIGFNKFTVNSVTGNTFVEGTLTTENTLTINGSTTTVSSTNTTITDNIIELNSGASSNANDSGILIERGSTGDNAFMGFDESSDTFVLGTTTATADATGNLTVTPSKITVGGVVIGSADINETELEILDGATLTTTELNYVDGVTSSIQTQLDARLPLAGGTMTGTLKLNDNVVIYLGTGDDLQLKHDGSNSFLRDVGAGNLIIEGENNIIVRSVTGSEKYIEAVLDGGVDLYHNNIKKFETTSGGATVTGDVTATGSFIIGSASMNETDLEKLDGITNGTAAANKALVLGASKEIATITTATITNLSTTTLTGGAITSSNFAGVTTLLIKNSSGTTLKTIRSPSS